jgi:hypothetical protein
MTSCHTHGQLYLISPHKNLHVTWHTRMSQTSKPLKTVRVHVNDDICLLNSSNTQLLFIIMIAKTDTTPNSYKLLWYHIISHSLQQYKTILSILNTQPLSHLNVKAAVSYNQNCDKLFQFSYENSVLQESNALRSPWTASPLESDGNTLVHVGNQSLLSQKTWIHKNTAGRTSILAQFLRTIILHGNHISSTHFKYELSIVASLPVHLTTAFWRVT